MSTDGAHGLVRALGRFVAKSRLVHFLAIGGALFAIAPREPDDRTAKISAARVDAAVTSERARAGRPLDRTEEDRVVDLLVEEEVLAREAARLGIGTDDPVVRARLSEAMRAALASTLRPSQLGEDEIDREAALLAASAPMRVRVRVHFFRHDRADAQKAAEALARGEQARPQEDRAPIPDDVWWTEEALARAAGREVAAAAMTTEVGRPSAVTPSAWGSWVVVPVERRRPEASDMRAEAAAAIQRRRQAEELARLVEQRRASYRIEIEAPPGDDRTLVSRGSE